MNRVTYSGKKGKRSGTAGKWSEGVAAAKFPCRTAEYQRNNINAQIIFLNNQNKSKTCVNLHQTKGEKYTLTKVISCPTNGGYLRLSLIFIGICIRNGLLVSFFYFHNQHHL